MKSFKDYIAEEHPTWHVTFKTGHKPQKVKGRNTAEAIKKAEKRAQRSGEKDPRQLAMYKGIKKVSEEVDLDEAQLDEISKDTLKSYVSKATGSANKAHWKAQSPKRLRHATREKAFKKHSKREKGIGSAAKRGVTGSDMDISMAKRHEHPHTRDYNWHDNPNDGDYKKRLKKDVAKDPKTHSLTGKKAPYKYESVELSEADIAEILRQYALSENVNADQLANLTEEEINEIIGKAIGGAFKLGAKAAVGAGRLAAKGAKKALFNKQGNRRGSMAAKNDKLQAKKDKIQQDRRDLVKNRKLERDVERAQKKLDRSKAAAKKY